MTGKINQIILSLGDLLILVLLASLHFYEELNCFASKNFYIHGDCGQSYNQTGSESIRQMSLENLMEGLRSHNL